MAHEMTDLDWLTRYKAALSKGQVLLTTILIYTDLQQRAESQLAECYDPTAEATGKNAASKLSVMKRDLNSLRHTIKYIERELENRGMTPDEIAAALEKISLDDPPEEQDPDDRESANAKTQVEEARLQIIILEAEIRIIKVKIDELEKRDERTLAAQKRLENLEGQLDVAKRILNSRQEDVEDIKLKRAYEKSSGGMKFEDFKAQKKARGRKQQQTVINFEGRRAEVEQAAFDWLKKHRSVVETSCYRPRCVFVYSENSTPHCDVSINIRECSGTYLLRVNEALEVTPIKTPRPKPSPSRKFREREEPKSPSSPTIL